MSDELLRLCGRFPVVPVLAFEDAGRAVEVCGALLEGGVAVLEIAFRGGAAVRSVAAVVKAFPQAVVAAGSVRTPDQLRQARDAGAAFAVSPGATTALLEAGVLPLLPGAATASEVMRLAERGFRFVKFFPARAMGGAATVAAFYGPLAEMRFCPTGGVDAGNAGEFLALPNVVCVGGSWLATEGDAVGDVVAKTRAAAGLVTTTRVGA